MAAYNFLEDGLFLRADGLGKRASRMEATPCGRVEGTGHFPGKDGIGVFVIGIGWKRSGNEALRVGVKRLGI